MIPDNVEKIIMTKEDYDRNVEQVIIERNELQQRIEKAVEYIESDEIDVCTIRYNDIYDTKKELLNILNGRSDE